MGLNDLLLNPKLVAGKTFHIEYRSDLLGGVVAICGQASIARKTQWEDILYRPWPLQYKMADMMAVPYYAWDNREPGEMRVWLRVSSGS